MFFCLSIGVLVDASRGCLEDVEVTVLRGVVIPSFNKRRHGSLNECQVWGFSLGVINYGAPPAIPSTVQNSLLTTHPKAKMLVLLTGIFVVHIAAAIMLFVSTISNVWMVSPNVTSSVGLWKNCTNGNCADSLSYGNEDALKAVQAFMILSIIFSVISLVVFVFQLFTMEKGNRFFLSGSTMLVCWNSEEGISSY
ncbi:hypothetical protein STEG23_008218 [Scotinomys teguina]